MVDQPLADKREPDLLHGRHWSWAGVVAMGIFLVAAVGLFAIYPMLQWGLGPGQPIAFSHRVHVTEKQISCVMCHGGALESAHAGIPPLETCMLCHQHIIIHHPQIERLRRHYDAREPVEWVRINQVPDFTFFNHQRHVRSGIDCGHCHGNIAIMDRVQLQQRFSMGYCVECHKSRGFSHDCLTCHR